MSERKKSRYNFAHNGNYFKLNQSFAHSSDLFGSSLLSFPFYYKLRRYSTSMEFCDECFSYGEVATVVSNKMYKKYLL